MPRASIVITIYNGKQAIEACLLSLNHQRLRANDDFNVIVMDDGSNDGTDERIRSLDVNYDLRYHYKMRTQNSSRAAARNMGIARCDGDIIIFLDGDQVAPPDFVREHLRCHDVHDDLVVVGLRNYLSPGEIDMERLRKGFSMESLPPVAKRDGRHRVFERFSENFNHIATSWHLGYSCNVSVRKKHLERAGYFNEGFKRWGLEDCECMFRLRQAGLKFVANKRCVVYHQFHDSPWDEEKYRQWHDNLQYFISLYPRKEEVSLQRLLAPFFDPAQREQSWIVCYERFEWAVRALQGRPAPTPDKICCLINKENPSVREVLLMIADACADSDVIVIDESAQSDLDVMIQTLDCDHSIMYYSYPDPAHREALFHSAGHGRRILL